MDARTAGKLAGRLALGLFWLAAIPFLFLTLYATAQLQTAAKEVIPQGGAVANISVISHSTALQILDRQIARLEAALDATNAAYASENRDYTTAKHQLRIQMIAINGRDPVDQGLLDCGSRDKTIGCFERVMVSAHRRLPGLSEGDAEDLRHSLAAADTTFLQFLTLSTRTQERLDQYEVLRARIAELRQRRVALTGGANAALHGVSESFDEIQRNMPWFKGFFVLPDGAVIGLFTGVMGAIGAVVFSLYERMRVAEGSQKGPKEDLAQSYVTRPLLGGLAGFIVYFAISAGSGILLEAGSAARAERGSGLSTAALATLGLLAGLGVENALQWLTGRARELFKG